ncbi:MAG TPA: type IV secretory system conjugative DNA transfer family protein [Peptococcaceae bacterium]|jgi:type IV secretion system protein VirD4|nr:type IV secretory system conjugative DNA transfer family protein [Peptococcaceae bacterium]
MTTEQAKREKRIQNYKIAFIVIYLFIAYTLLHFGTVLSTYEQVTIFNFNQFMTDFEQHMNTNPIFQPDILAFKILGFFSVFYFLFVVYFLTTRKKYMTGKEHGTAQWGGKNDIKPLLDKNPDQNIIFTQTEGLSLNTMQTGKNLNAVVIGGPGTGKTRLYVKPNILQAHSSYVVTDPKGELLRDTGAFLQKEGYKIKVLNLVQREYSDGYNPFDYMRDEGDVVTSIQCLIDNTTPEEAKSYDPFWERAEKALLQALFFYVWYELPKKDQSVNAVLDLLRKGDVKEDDPTFESELDQIFAQLALEKPNHLAVKQYSVFKQSSGKTARSILISTGVRLAIFNIQDVANIMAKDTLELDKLGDEKTALFVIISDAFVTYNFIAALMYTQLFETLYNKADTSPTGKLNLHVRCILDEFANIGFLPNIARVLGTMRGREISASIIVQNLSQIKATYKDDFETIVGNCDSLLFLGSMDLFTLEYVSKALGVETIDTYVYTYNKEQKWTRTSSKAYDVMKRELMLPDELERLPDEDCILIIRGTYPFYSKKYDVQKHKNAKYLNDYNGNYFFDYRSIRRLRPYETKVELPKGRRQEEDDLLRERLPTSRLREREHDFRYLGR